jgi:hypothetical protein
VFSKVLNPTHHPKKEKIMEAENIIIGQQYKIKAPGTTAREWWTVTNKHLNRREEWEITCTSPSSAHARIFRPESFKEMKQDKQLISNSVKLEHVLSDGSEIWIEDVVYLPFQKRRGRRPNSEKVSV